MRLLFLSLLFLTGCASFKKQEPKSIGIVRQFDVLCADKEKARGISGYTDQELIFLTKSRMAVRGRKKEEVFLPVDQCILEGVQRLEARPDSLKGAPFFKASCTVGEIQFSDQYLQILEQDEAVVYLRRHDGKIWVLPKKLCPLKAMEEGS